MALDPRMQLEGARRDAAHEPLPRDGHRSVVCGQYWSSWLLVKTLVDAEELEQLLHRVELHRCGARVVMPPPFTALETEVARGGNHAVP